MLVLSRKLGERIVIDAGGGIVVTLVQLDRNQARLGIEAPRDVKIYREELVDVFKQPNAPPTQDQRPQRRAASNL